MTIIGKIASQFIGFFLFLFLSSHTHNRFKEVQSKFVVIKKHFKILNFGMASGICSVSIQKALK